MNSAQTVRREWEAVCAGLGVTSRGWVDNEWSTILLAYSDGRRKYHDLGHITYGLGLINTYQHLANDVVALRYAWVRHDEKYLAHPRPKEVPSSEAWSAAIADEALAELNRQDLVSSRTTMEFRQGVVGLINVTHHSDQYRPLTTDQMLMADIDWSPMAAPWEEFLRNRKNIRTEYSQYSDKEFAIGRAGFISGLRGRESYFHLPVFKSLYDAQAKENIEREIELLALPWERQAEIMAAV